MVGACGFSVLGWRSSRLPTPCWLPRLFPSQKTPCLSFLLAAPNYSWFPKKSPMFSCLFSHKCFWWVEAASNRCSLPGLCPYPREEFSRQLQKSRNSGSMTLHNLSKVTRRVHDDTSHWTQVSRTSKATFLPVTAHCSGEVQHLRPACWCERRKQGSQTPSEVDGGVFPLLVPSRALIHLTMTADVIRRVQGWLSLHNPEPNKGPPALITRKK